MRYEILLDYQGGSKRILCAPKHREKAEAFHNDEVSLGAEGEKLEQPLASFESARRDRKLKVQSLEVRKGQRTLLPEPSER